jgi:hypothetical protein
LFDVQRRQAFGHHSELMSISRSEPMSINRSEVEPGF